MEETKLIVPINRPVAEELETDVDLGTDYNDDDFDAFISNQPIAVRLQDVYELLNHPLPVNYSLYKMFNIWLVPHRFSLNRRKGNAEPTAVGIEVQYIHENTTCSVVSLLPAPSWKEHGKVDFNVQITGELSASGEFSKVADFGIDPVLRLGNLNIGVGAKGGVGFSFKTSVITPIISAVGQGGSQCQWHFEKDEEPLFGRTIETWAALALPKRQKTLTYRMRCYYMKRTFFFPTRREGEPVLVSCHLATQPVMKT